MTHHEYTEIHEALRLMKIVKPLGPISQEALKKSSSILEKLVSWDASFKNKVTEADNFEKVNPTHNNEL